MSPKLEVCRALKDDMNTFHVRVSKELLQANGKHHQYAPVLLKAGKRRLRVLARTPIKNEVKPKQIWINEALRFLLSKDPDRFLRSEVEIYVEFGFRAQWVLALAHLRHCPRKHWLEPIATIAPISIIVTIIGFLSLFGLQPNSFATNALVVVIVVAIMITSAVLLSYRNLIAE